MGRILKWVLIGWAAFWVFVLGVVLVALIVHEPVPKSSIVKVEFDGDLSESDDPTLDSFLGGETQVSLRSLTTALRAAGTDDRITGVVFEVKNQGMSIAQLQEVEEAMAEYRKANKWSAAFLETAGEFSPGTGSYALAATTDHVVLAPPGEVNLVGLRAEVPFLRGMFDKLEITPYFNQRYDYKTAVNMFTQKDFTPAHKESLASMVNSLQQSVLELIAGRRDKSNDEVLTWLKTGPHPSGSAKEKGIIDEVGYWDTVLGHAQELTERDDPFIDISTYAQNLPSRNSQADVAIITAQGAIMRGESNPGFAGGDPSVGSDTLTKAFRDARNDGVKAVLFRVDSPGGSYVASDLIRREVELTRDAGIPVFVSMGSLAASGGYFISMDATRIIADPATLTGSIGVYAGTFATRKFFQDFLGITFGVYETEPDSMSYSFLDGPDAKESEARNAILDRIYKDFVQKAANGRKKSYEEIHAVAQGRVWTGKEALERGLVDELGGFHVALARLKENLGIDPTHAVTLKPYPAPETPLKLLQKSFGGGSRVGKLAAQVSSVASRLALAQDNAVLLFPRPLSLQE